MADRYGKWYAFKLRSTVRKQARAGRVVEPRISGADHMTVHVNDHVNLSFRPVK
jgi:hypothetical protein